MLKLHNSLNAQMRKCANAQMEVYASFRHDAGCNIHGLQFLKQQLARVWYFDKRKLRAILAHVAAVNAHLVIHSGDHAAALAHVHLVLVR